MSDTKKRYSIRCQDDSRLFDWLSKEADEDVLEPDLPIIDPHHHFWDHHDKPSPESPDEWSAHIPRGAWHRSQKLYMRPEILDDIRDHNVVGTVYVQCGSFYRPDGPPHLRQVGEVERCQAIATEAPGPPALCCGIVGTCDLSHPQVEQSLLAMMEYAHFRGVRCAAPHGEQHEYGLQLLEKYNLVLDICYVHPYDPRILRGPFLQMALRHPNLKIVLDHLGGLVGPNMGGSAVQESWRADLAHVAQECPNVYCKVGGVLMLPNGFDLHTRPSPIGSEELADMMMPWYGYAIDCFGPHRCMFESNFPVDKAQVSYRNLYNCFKIIAARKKLTDEQKRAIFHDTAKSVYRL